MKTFSIDPEDAPLFYTEGAPDAFLEVLPAYKDGLDRMKVGDEIIVITWLHRARRKVLKVHPRGNVSNPLTGVFSTRSPDRPNPLGLHRVKVLEIKPGRLHIGPIEAIDGTPVIDALLLHLLQRSSPGPRSRSLRHSGFVHEMCAFHFRDVPGRFRDVPGREFS